MKILNKNIPFYSFLLISFLIFKFWYSNATTNELLFLLAPTDFLLSIFSSGKHQYVQNVGFYDEGLNIVIEKSCSGFNFFLLSFVVCAVVALPYFNNWKHKIALLCSTAIISWALTIGVNVARISTAILLKQHLRLESSFASQFHELQGTFIYLFCLLFFYKALKYTLDHLKPIA
jgi:exosortase K